MRKRIMICVIAVCATVLAGCGGKEGGIIDNKEPMTLPTLGAVEKYTETEEATKDDSIKKCEMENYSFEYPDTWDVVESITADVAIARLDGITVTNETISVSSMLAQGSTVANFCNNMERQYQQMTETVSVEREDVEFGRAEGSECVKLIYEEQGATVIREHYVAAKGDYMYVLTYTYQEGIRQSEYSEAKDIIGSLVIRK